MGERVDQCANCGYKPDRYLQSLARRETEVLSLVAEGLANSEIAVKLFLSTRTVEGYIGKIFSKLGVTPEEGSGSKGASRVKAAMTYLGARYHCWREEAHDAE